MPDEQLLLLADSEAGILHLARSERLSSLIEDGLAVSMLSETFPNRTVKYVAKSENMAEPGAVPNAVKQNDPALRWRQFFLVDEKGTNLAAACTSPERFADKVSTLNFMLESYAAR